MLLEPVFPRQLSFYDCMSSSSSLTILNSVGQAPLASRCWKLEADSLEKLVRNAFLLPQIKWPRLKSTEICHQTMVPRHERVETAIQSRFTYNPANQLYQRWSRVADVDMQDNSTLFALLDILSVILLICCNQIEISSQNNKAIRRSRVRFSEGLMAEKEKEYAEIKFYII